MADSDRFRLEAGNLTSQYIDNVAARQNRRQSQADSLYGSLHGALTNHLQDIQNREAFIKGGGDRMAGNRSFQKFNRMMDKSPTNHVPADLDRPWYHDTHIYGHEHEHQHRLRNALLMGGAMLAPILATKEGRKAAGKVVKGAVRVGGQAARYIGNKASQAAAWVKSKASQGSDAVRKYLDNRSKEGK